MIAKSELLLTGSTYTKTMYYRISRNDSSELDTSSELGASWVGVPSVKPTLPHATHREQKEFVALKGSSGLVDKMWLMAPDHLETGRIVKVLGNKGPVIAWEEMFEAAGVDGNDLSIVFGAKLEKIDEELLEVAYRAISGDVLTERHVCSLSSLELKNLCSLCLRKRVFQPKAQSGVALAIESTAKKNDSVERLRLALALSRVPSADRRRQKLHFERIERKIGWYPKCYERDLTTIGKAVERVIAQGNTPTILLRIPEGAPVDDIVEMLTCAFGYDGEERIEVSDASSALDIIGCSSSYGDALPGAIARGIYLHGDAPIVIRNADKIRSLKKTDGDCIDFVKRVCGCGGLPTDLYMGIPMSPPINPVIIIEASGSGKSSFETACNVIASLHPLSRSEKMQTLRDALFELNIAVDSDTIPYLVDNYCLDEGVEMMENALQGLTEFSSSPSARNSLSPKDVSRILPAPDRNDPRHLLGRKRSLLERSGERYSLLAESLVKKALNDDVPHVQQEAMDRLKILLGSIPNERTLPSPSAESLKRKLAKTHPFLCNASEVVGTIAASLAARSPLPIVLSGPAGTGKTTLAKAVADALGDIPFVKRDFSGMSAQELFGSPNSPSLITEAISAYDGCPGVLLLDEVDKPCALPSHALCSLLDMKAYTDSYLNLQVDLSRWLIILTANDTNLISPYVLSRSAIVDMPGYAPSEKARVAKYLFQRISLSAGKPGIGITQEALDYLSALDDEAGLRKLEQNALTLIAGHPDEATIEIDDVKTAFPSVEKRHAGIRIIMPRGGARGGAALACVNAIDSRDPLPLSGLPDFDRCINSVRIALKSSGIGCIGLASLIEEDKTEHSLFSYAALGIAVALALANEGLSTDLSSTAFLGELYPSGEVKPFTDPEGAAKAPFLISRARVHGVETIVCPRSFAETNRSYAESQRVDLVPADHLSQAVDYAKNIQCLDAFLDSILQ